MKKWLGESSSLCSHNNKNIPDDTETVSEDAASAPSSTLRNESKFNCSRSSVKPVSSKLKMGLGVSSEPVPTTTTTAPLDQTEEPQNTTATARRCHGEIPVSVCHPSVAFITSVNSRIQVSSPCHHFSPQTVSVQLHSPKPTCSSYGSKEAPRLMSLISPLKVSSSSSDHSEHFSCLSGNTAHHVSENSSNNLRDIPTPSTASSSTQGLAISLPSLYPSGSNVCHVQCMSDTTQPSHPQNLSPSCSENILESSSESESRPGSANGSWCGMGVGLGLHSQHKTTTQCDYDTSLAASAAKNVHHHSSHLAGGSGVTHSTNGASASSGCGHWCSTCRVRVQVEVECVPGSQRSPNGSRRGIRTLSFPKRVRHKVKAPTKDLNGTHKKKKSPWSFRLNCRLRANKSDSEQEPGISALNVGCVSCVCPGYRRPDTEPVYRSVIENTNSTNSIALHTPMVDLSRFNPEAFPVNDLEENARQERAREMAEGVEPPSGFIPLLRENPNSLALPLTYNSMLDLQVLLESSLRLGLGGPRRGGNAYPGETSETSLLSCMVHTQVDYIHCLVPDLLAITNCGFYWGKMDRYEAERLLENRPEGTFLLRDSAQEEYLFSVSFRRYGRSLHARIEQWNHKFSFDSHDPGVFASHTVCGLIEHYKDPSCCMFFEPLLTNPLARTFPFPLQHLCRATICSKTNYDGINYLELPKSLKNYLKEYHYKQRVRVRHLD